MGGKSAPCDKTEKTRRGIQRPPFIQQLTEFHAAAARPLVVLAADDGQLIMEEYLGLEILFDLRIDQPRNGKFDVAISQFTHQDRGWFNDQVKGHTGIAPDQSIDDAG